MNGIELVLFFAIGCAAGVAMTLLFLQDRYYNRWQKQQALAKQRELHDSGRSHLAREDAGPPARVHRAKMKTARRKP